MRRSGLSSLLILALLLASAVSLLCFRFFITVDGPIHVLHASLLSAPWNTAQHTAQGIVYDSGWLHGWLGDRLLSVLLLFSTPTQAHDLYAAFVNCAVVLSVLAYLRAHGTRMGMAALWLAPLLFSALLIMGLFHFLLGVALAFASVAWWKWRAPSPHARWTGLLLGVILAWCTHRSAPTLLCMLWIPTLLIEMNAERTTTAPAQRRSRLGWLLLAGALLALCIWQMAPVIRKISQHGVPDLPSLNEDFLLQPLFVLNHVTERWFVFGIGALLFTAFLAGAWARRNMGRRLFWHDALPVLFSLFAVVAWSHRTSAGHELFIAERSAWLTLLLLTIWLVVIADAQRGWVANVMGGTALCALPLHLAKLVQAEEAIAQLQRVHLAAMAACEELEPGTIVLPVMADAHWLMQHEEAYVAMEHDGILLLPDERVGLSDTSGRALPADLRRLSRDPVWLLRHWREGIPTEVDHVLFIGNDIDRTVHEHPWSVLLSGRYQQAYADEHARIFTLIPPPRP